MSKLYNSLIKIIKHFSIDGGRHAVVVSLHVLPYIVLTTITCFYLRSTTIPTYLAFSFVFALNLIFALNSVMKGKLGTFYYLLSGIFTLGFWAKFSVNTITASSYREPIGTFINTATSEPRVLLVSLVGALGLLIAQFISHLIFKTDDHLVVEEKSKSPIIPLIILTLVAGIMTFINLRYNIMLFGLSPSITLPLKGNVIYFLALTKGITFLLFYYCFKRLTALTLFWSAAIVMICSTGVLSRATIIIFFAAIFVYLLQRVRKWTKIDSAKKFALFSISFIIFSYLTVTISTELRHFFYKNRDIHTAATTSLPSRTTASIDSSVLSSGASQYLKMFLGRWIGMEGVMAVDSYKAKNFSLFGEGASEVRYSGKSFYTKIANPERYKRIHGRSRVTTSVPGPIAFFYYSNSFLFVLVSMALVSLFYSFVEAICTRYFSKQCLVATFISTFFVFDFFQLGIAPIAHLKYTVFTLFSLFVYYNLPYIMRTGVQIYERLLRDKFRGA